MKKHLSDLERRQLDLLLLHLIHHESFLLLPDHLANDIELFDHVGHHERFDDRVDDSDVEREVLANVRGELESLIRDTKDGFETFPRASDECANEEDRVGCIGARDFGNWLRLWIREKKLVDVVGQELDLVMMVEGVSQSYRDLKAY